MRRAAVSIVSNVAEGLERQTRSMFIQYHGRTKARRESCAPGFILHMNKAIFPKMNSGMYLLLPKCAVNKWQNLFNTSKLNPILVASGKME